MVVRVGQEHRRQVPKLWLGLLLGLTLLIRRLERESVEEWWLRGGVGECLKKI